MSQLLATIINGISGLAEDFWQNLQYSEVSPWQSAIDIVLVAIIIYYLFSFLKGSRSISVILGLIVISLVFLLSKSLNLLTLGWLLDKFFTVILVAIPVIFQQELRLALERIGKNPFFSTDKGSQNHKLIKELVSTCFSMAEMKIGALIVIQKTIPLKEQIETGVAINADLSEELLMTIFTNKSPLHDGAVIIDNGKIIAAKCILPNITDARHKDLGTRHKAALGLSDLTDAIVLVISEERGMVSLAQNGYLERNLSEEKLRSKLEKAILKTPYAV